MSSRARQLRQQQPTKTATGPALAVSSAPAKKSRLKRNKKVAKGIPVPPPSRTATEPSTLTSPTAPIAPDSGDNAITKRQSCEDILTSGYVQSFVDFFYLTHRPDPNASQNNVVSQTTEPPEDINISPPEMSFLRDNLTKAEEARRKGDTPNVYNSYR